jgi:hypothetical protein
LSTRAVHSNRPDSALIKVQNLFAVRAPYRLIAAIRDLPAEAGACKRLNINSGFRDGVLHGPCAVGRHRSVIDLLLHNLLRPALSIEGICNKGGS